MMLTELISLIGVVKQIVYYIFLCSVTIGEIIVSGIQTTFEFTSALCSTFWSALVIIGEDFGVFLLDFTSILVAVLQNCINFVDYIFKTLAELIDSFQSGIYGIIQFIVLLYDGILHMFARLITSVTNTALSIKHFFVLFGHGVWFAVTFIPLSVVYICISITYFIGKFFDELYNIICSFCTNFGVVVSNIFEFVVDVPVESVAGLIIAVCIFYVLIKFYLVVLAFLQNVYNNLISKCRITFPRRSNKTNDVKNGSCVICYERNKCLLTMPCRHLCMCVECWNQIERYRVNNEPKSCPVCRRTVQYTIHVY